MPGTGVYVGASSEDNGHQPSGDVPAFESFFELNNGGDPEIILTDSSNAHSHPYDHFDIDWGDGIQNSSNAPYDNVMHIYGNVGAYTITMYNYDPFGNMIGTSTQDIQIANSGQ